MYLLRETTQGSWESYGHPLSFDEVQALGILPPPLLWVPNEANGDPTLRAVRRKFLGKHVYGIGGIAISCAPQWTRLYAPTVALRVIGIARDTGAIEELGTGNQLGNYGYGPSFYAKDPIRFVFAATTASPTGENFSVSGTKGACPTLVMADFQVDLAISATPPPVAIWPSSRRLRVGDRRDEVLWNRGYPWEIGDRRQLLGQDTWRYGIGLGAYSMTFKAGRITSIAAR